MDAVDYGALLSGAYYFNKYVGGQVESAFHPQDKNDGGYTGQAGIIFRFPVSGMTPFVHGLAGATKWQGPDNPPYHHSPFHVGARADGWWRSGLQPTLFQSSRRL